MKLSTACYTIILLPNACSFSFISQSLRFNGSGTNLARNLSFGSGVHATLASSFHSNKRNSVGGAVQLNLSSETNSDSKPEDGKRALNDFKPEDQNRAYINGLLQNLSAALDRWIVNGSLNTVRCYE
jgi:hypothetical protein